MIADTDPELRQRLYGRLLEIEVHSDCVATAAEAVDKIEETPYALLIVDVGLPHRGVEQLLARVSRMESRRRPIVLVLAPSAEATRSLDVDIVQIVLRRPVDVAQLVDLVRNCVRSAAKGDRRGKSDGDSDGRRQVIS